MHLGLGGGTYRVQTEQRAGGEDDAAAIGFGEVNNVRIAQQGGAAHRHQDLAGLKHGFGDGGESGGRCGIHNDVAAFGQFFGRHHIHRALQLGAGGFGLGFIAARYGLERQPFNAGVERTANAAADGAVSCDPYFHDTLLLMPRSECHRPPGGVNEPAAGKDTNCWHRHSLKLIAAPHPKTPGGC